MSIKKSVFGDKIYLQQLERELLVQKIIGTIQEIPQDSLLSWLKRENDQTVSLVLCLAPAELSASLVKGFDLEPARRVIAAMAKMGTVHDSALQSLSEVLEELKSNSIKRSQNLGGTHKVKELLRSLPPVARENLLQGLEAAEASAKLAKELRSSLVDVPKLAKLFPKDLALLCAQLHDRVLASALFKEHHQVIQAFLSALPGSRRCQVEDLLAEFANNPRKGLRVQDKNKATEAVLATATELKNQGKLVYPWDEEFV